MSGRVTTIAFMLLITTLAQARADVVVLVSGEQLEGASRWVVGHLEVTTADGVRLVPTPDVSSIAKEHTPEQLELIQRAATVPVRDVAGRYALARGAIDLQAWDLARELLLGVLTLEPDHLGARLLLLQGLGFENVEGRWIAPEDRTPAPEPPPVEEGEEAPAPSRGRGEQAHRAGTEASAARSRERVARWAVEGVSERLAAARTAHEKTARRVAHYVDEVGRLGGELSGARERSTALAGEERAAREAVGESRAGVDALEATIERGCCAKKDRPSCECRTRLARLQATHAELERRLTVARSAAAEAAVRVDALARDRATAADLLAKARSAERRASAAAADAERDLEKAQARLDEATR